MPRESSIVRAVLRYLNGLDDCVARKLHGDSFSVTGDPDIYGCYRGRCFQLEVKQEGGRLSPAQKYRLDEWRDAGAFCSAIRSVADAKALIEAINEAVER